MIFARPLLLCLALLGCEARRAQVPDWVDSAPGAAVMAVSFQAEWAMQQPRLRTLLERFPLAGRSLDRLLTRAGINLRGETGRLTVYLLNPEPPSSPRGVPLPPSFLIQLGGFRDPGGLQVAIADAFPADPAAEDRDHPLFAVLDLAPHRIRAQVDGAGRVWLGDLDVLARRSEGRSQALAGAAAWISPGAAVQGFIRPALLLDDFKAELPGDLARNLPRGIESLAWGVVPGRARDALNGFELSLAGNDQAIQHAQPWLQRFLGAANALPGVPAQAPEILQETARISLRCQLSQEQVDVAMARLDLPPMGLR